MNRPRIVLAETLDEVAEQKLAAAAEVIRPRENTQKSLVAAIADCDALVARTHTPVTRELLDAGRRLKVVGIAGVGLDRVDLDAARERGIRIVHTPDAASDAVAEFTAALMLELLRPIGSLSAAYRAGQYRAVRAAPHGPELCELVVGIVGVGRIGSRVARICSAGFGARVLINDIRDVGPFPFATETVDKPALYRMADIISLHVPLTAQTRGLIGAEALAMFKPGARLINTARGKVVDTPALLAALQSGQLAGATLDVTDPEPLPSDHPLWQQGNCILTPHVAARTHGGLRRMFDVVDEVLAILRSEADTAAT